MNINSTSKTSQNSHTSAPASASKPATQQQGKSEPPAAKQSSIQDSVMISSEAEELAAVDPAVCKNDWRCLEALDLRGLLG
jgi:hypothetical protein